MIPGRLTAPPPGWTTSADVVVIGSGIAGLTAALRCRQALQQRIKLKEMPGRLHGAAINGALTGGLSQADPEVRAWFESNREALRSVTV